MAGFRKAKCEQAYLKALFYGPPGSGKSLTALLCAEGLAKLAGKRIALIDTEHGCDFYFQHVAERKAHPEPFDVDVLHTRSIVEMSREVKKLSPDDYCCVIIDSLSHAWESCIAAYAGKQNAVGGIPLHAWSGVKRPFKDLMAFCLNAPLHVFFAGRQANEFDTDEASGELKRVGVKVKCEAEAAYEPHLVMRMEAVKQGKTKLAIITAFAEKDRSGLIAGRTLAWPTFDTLIRPLLGLLGKTQARLPTMDETAIVDAEALSAAEHEKEIQSAELAAEFQARFTLCKTAGELEAVSKELTPQAKKRFTASDLDTVRSSYKNRLTKLQPAPTMTIDTGLADQLRQSIARTQGNGPPAA